MRAFSVFIPAKASLKGSRISDNVDDDFSKDDFLIPRDNLMRQKHWQRILVRSGLPSRFLAVSFLPALPWLDEFHYVTSRVLAYKEVKDVWKCVRYCILSSLGIPPDSHLRFPPRFCDTCYRLLRIDASSYGSTFPTIPVSFWAWDIFQKFEP